MGDSSAAEDNDIDEVAAQPAAPLVQTAAPSAEPEQARAAKALEAFWAAATQPRGSDVCAAVKNDRGGSRGNDANVGPASIAPAKLPPSDCVKQPPQNSIPILSAKSRAALDALAREKELLETKKRVVEDLARIAVDVPSDDEAEPSTRQINGPAHGE